MEIMGFVGRREGMAAMATATVFLPEGRQLSENSTQLECPTQANEP